MPLCQISTPCPSSEELTWKCVSFPFTIQNPVSNALASPCSQCKYPRDSSRNNHIFTHLCSPMATKRLNNSSLSGIAVSLQVLPPTSSISKLASSSLSSANLAAASIATLTKAVARFNLTTSLILSANTAPRISDSPGLGSSYVNRRVGSGDSVTTAQPCLPWKRHENSLGPV